MSKNVIRLMILSLLLHVASSYLAVAQEMATVEDDEANICDIQLRRDGNVLIVEYDLNLGNNVSSCKVDMSLSLDGGESFTYRPTDIGQYLSGDVGKVSGSGKKIIYFSLNERMEKVMSGKEMEILLSVYDKKIKKGKSLAPLTDSQQKRKWKYLSNVELNNSINITDLDGSLYGLDYIGGLQYKNRFFLGIGVGLSFAYNFTHIYVDFFSPYGYKRLETDYDRPGYSYFITPGDANTADASSDHGYNLLHVPLYLHCKGRFLKSRCSPYAALSLGGRFSSAYRQSGFVETSVGVSYKMSNAREMYLSWGMCVDSNMEHYHIGNGYLGNECYEGDGISGVSDHLHVQVEYGAAVSTKVRLGFSF